MDESMKIVEIASESLLPLNFTGIAILPEGTKVWIENGQVHREDGPAIEYYTGDKGWYLNGNIFLSKEEFFDALSDKQKDKIIWNLDQWR